MTLNTVAWGHIAVPSDIYQAAVEAGQKYGIDPAILLSIGYFESGYNRYAKNYNPPIEASYGWLQFNRLAGNGSRQLNPTFDIEALYDPNHSADLAAQIISENLDKGQSTYDAISPWSTRDKAVSLLNQQGYLFDNPTGDNVLDPGPTQIGVSAVPSSSGPFNFEWPKWKIDLGLIHGSISSEGPFKVLITVGAIVMLFVGVFHLTALDSVANKTIGKERI